MFFCYLTLLGFGVKIKENPKKAFWIGFPIFLYKVFVCLNSVIVFSDIKKDTISVTNIGFAMCLAISSVCFSWVKTLDIDKEKPYIDSIKRCGEVSLGIGLVFVLASAFKYFAIYMTSETPYKSMLFYKGVSVILALLSWCLYVVAFFTSSKFLDDLLQIIYQRHEKYFKWFN